MWTLTETNGLSIDEKARVVRACELGWSVLERCLVEAAGIEPASVNPLPSALHVYPTHWF